MQPITPKTIETITEAGKEAVSFIITKTTGDNHPDYEKAVIEGTTEAIKELARNDTGNAVKIYESLKIKREQRDFFNFSKVLNRVASLIKKSPTEKISEDNDVFWGLLEHSKNISNEEMQELIARIIAGEYNAPGSYKMSTLQTVKMLGESELKLLEKISSLLIDRDQIPHEVFNLGDNVKKIMDKIGVDFGSLQTLQSLGLFLPNEMINSIPNREKKNFSISYFDKTVTFSPENENFHPIKIPSYYSLSDAGKQILSHLNPPYNDEYHQWIIEYYKIANYKLVE